MWFSETRGHVRAKSLRLLTRWHQTTPNTYYAAGKNVFSPCKVYYYLEETLAYTHLPEHRSQFCTRENMTIREGLGHVQAAHTRTDTSSHASCETVNRMYENVGAGEWQGCCCAVMSSGQGMAHESMSSLQLWSPTQDGANEVSHIPAGSAQLDSVLQTTRKRRM